MLRVAVFFLFALTESVSPCLEFADCSNLDRLLECALETSEQEQLPPQPLFQIGQEAPPATTTPLLDVLLADETTEDERLWANELAAEDNRNANSLLGVTSCDPSDQEKKLLGLNATVKVLLSNRDELVQIKVSDATLEFLRICGLPTEWAQLYAAEQRISCFATPNDQVLKAAFAQFMYRSQSPSVQHRPLQLPYDPLNSLEGLCVLQEDPEARDQVFTGDYLVPLIDLFKEVIGDLDSAIYLWKEGSLRWLDERYGSTKVDPTTADFLRHLIPLVRAAMLDDIVSRNLELHDSARVYSTL